MDKYETFLDDVVISTENDDLEWDTVSPSHFEDYILHSINVYAAYSTLYKKGKSDYTLVFVEKKFFRVSDDSDIPYESYRCELIVIKDKKLIFTLNKDYVDSDNLLQLGRLIESRNNDAKELFDNFN